MEDNIPTAAGLSSFNLLDEKKFFSCLDIKQGMTMLDFACGLGNYAIASAPYLGVKGILHAVDLWEEGIETLNVRTALAKVKNIRTRVADAAEPLPFEAHCIDICLMATVVHILIHEGKFAKIMSELQRVLKPLGTIAIVEFEKIDIPPGPPLSRRLAPEELAQQLLPYGFTCSKSVSVGQFNYLSLFSRQQITDD